MQSKQQVIFVDDESFWSTPYVQELEKLYDVLYHKNAEEGLTSVSGHPQAKLLVLDIMMPAPTEAPGGRTENGLATGIWFLEEIRKTIIERPLPVIVLTNRGLKAVEAGLADAAVPKGLLTVRAKIETPKFYLPHLVRETIDRLNPTKI
jgi:CheY-like chemotaxis protein